MSISKTIKNQLKAKLQSCQSIQVVYGHPQTNPTGFPAAFLTVSDMEGEFSSNAENSRLYAYKAIIIFPIGSDFPIPDNEDRLEYAEDVIATCVDEIIDAIDTDIELDGTPVLYINAADVMWGHYDYDGGIARAAELTLKVYTEKTDI